MAIPSRSFRRAVVTGGAGFLGSHLCARLLAGGVDVVCVDNLVTGSTANVRRLAEHSGFQLVDQDVVASIDIEGPVDLVLHFASPASPPDYLRHPIDTLLVGSQGTVNALTLAREKAARFVLASTSEVYGDPLEHPQRETYWGNVNPVGPRSVYDEAKRFAEALTVANRKTYGVDTAIVRIFNTYGPWMRTDDGRAVPTFIRQALRGEPITVTGDGRHTRSLCYVDDTVAGILALAESPHPGPVNIGSPDELSILDLASRIRDLTGSSSGIEFVDRPVDDPNVRRPDISLAHSLLGWKPETSLTQGLERTISWFAERLFNRSS
ncbi:MAG TPA: UDP-glucuronic acid decarboxylase family protein [Actinophytocola sp.]|uniref:UDP-glucuronic acid decarboxylase family protein n=1 Tax=Actinophytocola sp. TaxID=1872138 RepID=UPI002DDD5AAC|nr:UDP-glucuronic acid decarboxylase family protein [Actinophytocola sp.]HEV2778219.1 UDP-glucuronic acid decarboxylase family protein [Actinophytocola sp.]